MLRQMENLNRLFSPMHAMEENLDDTEAIRQKKIEFIKFRELTKSPYSIGSITDIETKVTKLEEQIKGLKSNFPLEYSDDETNLENSYDNSMHFNINNKKELKEVEKFAGVFSIVSTLDFNKPERIKKIVKKSIKIPRKSKGQSNDKALPKFIELCQHPGFNQLKITELPSQVQIVDIIQQVLQVQKFKNNINIYQKFFNKWFYCQAIQNIIKDMFWYFVISKYGSDIDKNDLPNYFSRAAMNYVTFLYGITVESLYYQEKFKKILPNLLSQVLYAALSECFPDSWIQFNDEFIETVIQLVYFWLGGIRPTKGLWRQWDMDGLKPTEQKLKEKAIKTQSKLGLADSDLGKQKFDSDVIKPNITLKTTRIGALNQTNNVLFNLNGHSPLIQTYLHKHKINMNIGTNNLIKHKEILPVINDGSAETLADIVSASLRSLKDRSVIYKESHARNLLKSKKFQRFQQLSNRENEKHQETLLINKPKVHRLSNLMMHEFLKDKDSISFGADKAIMDAIISVK